MAYWRLPQRSDMEMKIRGIWKKGERKKRILSVFILLCFVTAASSFSAGRPGEGVPDERAAGADGT